MPEIVSTKKCDHCFEDVHVGPALVGSPIFLHVKTEQFACEHPHLTFATWNGDHGP